MRQETGLERWRRLLDAKAAPRPRIGGFHHELDLVRDLANRSNLVDAFERLELRRRLMHLVELLDREGPTP